MYRFRPHHFMCALSFEGHGYSAPFVQNFENICATLKARPDTPIQVIGDLDDICKACPHHKGHTCETQKKIQQLDHSHSQILNLKNGEILTWSQAKRRIAENMTIEKFQSACSTCQWQTLGVCERALKRHRSRPQ